jgi:L-aminopeptidase/D-esterase-like protein
VRAGDARRLALALPEAAEAPHHGIPSFRVAKKIFATMPDDAHLHVMLDRDEVDMAVGASPRACEELWWGKQLAGVRVRLAAADRRLLEMLLKEAWRRRAPKRLVGKAPVLLLAVLLLSSFAGAAEKPRGRELGIPFPGKTGPNNAITDVPGVAVGHVTLISGEGRVVPGKGPVRTGVTAILTRPRGDWDFVMAATFNQNGNGDMTGVNWIAESGFLEGPILLTGTHSVGTVRDAAIQWQEEHGREFVFTYPIVSETFDALSDSTGRHVKPEHVFAALDSAAGGRVVEGAVGGGTGMTCNGFKGGIGTSSRVVAEVDGKSYTVGVLVQCNYGGDLQILGAPVGREIQDLKSCLALDGPPARAWLEDVPHCGAKPAAKSGGEADLGRGSIVVILATDAPLLPTQLERLAKRVGMGLGRLGSWAGNQSGDLFLAFSTANRSNAKAKGEASVRMLANDDLNPFFRATIEATEEAVVNAMLAADTMTGADGLRVYALPADLVVKALRKYGRMPEAPQRPAAQ